MNIVPVSQMLTPVGLVEPRFDALLPNQDNYSVYMIQPDGDITADSQGVRHTDAQRAELQFTSFLQNADTLRASLAIAPEYSVPWNTLISSLQQGTAPSAGALWVLGCESISYSRLTALKTSMASVATFVFEEMTPDDARFCDPLVYVFRAPLVADANKNQLVCLIQFKTCAMGDKEHFEVNGLQKGNDIYRFGASSGISLASLICSDSFAFTDVHATQLYDRALILHLQCNPKPRQDQYRLIRNRLFYCANGQTELLCLNWAKQVVERSHGGVTAWKNIAGSAWYLQPPEFDDRDATLRSNHEKGLYYTWNSSLRSHVLFFNYEPSVFYITATKVFHQNVPRSVSLRRGPQLQESGEWDLSSRSWKARTHCDDLFVKAVPDCGDAASAISTLAVTHPLYAERVLALTAGRITEPAWFSPKVLDSCNIEGTEIVRRITFCQDDAPEAIAFRVGRLKRCAQLSNLLTSDGFLPPGLSDLREGATFTWSPSFPHHNLKSSNNKLATVIYLGEDVGDTQIEAVAKKAADIIGRSYSKSDDVLESHQRLHVCYRNSGGTISGYDFSEYIRYDEPRTDSPYDFTRSK